MLSEKRLTLFILCATALLTLIAGILILIHPPALYPDPGWGFQVLRSMRMGGAFNMLCSPDHADIAKNNYAFLSWWSPGQYLVPYFFISILKLNIGQASALTITLCSLTGLTGLLFFFKKIGFSPLLSAISIAFIASQQAYFIPFVFYNGGETILFAFIGWFLYGCCYFTKINWQLVIFILLSGVIGFFCKSAFLWIYFAGLLYLWLKLSTGNKIMQWLINGTAMGMPALLSLVVIYITYLSKGDNPAANVNGIKLSWEAFSFPLASPLLTAFSIDDLSNGIINHPLSILLALAGLSILLVTFICKRAPNTNYRLLLVILYIAGILFYGINFLRQANISYEARHMRIIGLVLTPGIIYVLSKFKKPYWVLLALAWIYIVTAGYRFLYTGYNINVNRAARGTTGLAQIFIDQPTLNYVNRLDKQEHDAIFVFISSDIGLEITHNRIITCPQLDDNLRPENDLDKYYGHAGPIYLVLPKSYVGDKAAVYFKNFPGYHDFVLKQTRNNYVVYSAQ